MLQKFILVLLLKNQPDNENHGRGFTFMKEPCLSFLLKFSNCFNQPVVTFHSRWGNFSSLNINIFLTA